jgi:phage-related minor tail protein
MEALIADIDADMKLLRREIESVKRKLARLETELHLVLYADR